MNGLCICCSGKPFNACCDRFLNQHKLPKTPEQLMRSRYSAYALGGYGDYLAKTWLPSARQQLSALELSKKSIEWLGLEVLNKSQKGNEAIVEFAASFLGEDKEKTVHHEKSVFTRIDKQWFYVSGEILNSDK